MMPASGLTPNQLPSGKHAEVLLQSRANTLSHSKDIWLGTGFALAADSHAILFPCKIGRVPGLQGSRSARPVLRELNRCGFRFLSPATTTLFFLGPGRPSWSCSRGWGLI